MPIPVLIGLGLGVAAGVTGVVKAVDAKQKNNQAQNVNEKAKKIKDNAIAEAEMARKTANSSLAMWGLKRAEAITNEYSWFRKTFERIHHVEASFSTDFGMQIERYKAESIEMKELEMQAFSIVSGAFKGSAAGALTAFGAYGGVASFGAASTGTAIAGLSGAAASNATLAFLGGGTLASGGLGIAGGTMVLGGLVTGPALAVLGFTLSAKASTNLDNARSNLARAREIAEEMATVRDGCYKIRDIAHMYMDMTQKLRGPLAYFTEELAWRIEQYGTDYRCFPAEAKKIAAAGMTVFETIMPLLNKPHFLTNDGAIDERALQIIDGAKAKLPEVRQLMP